jgi:hypothetical protein
MTVTRCVRSDNPGVPGVMPYIWIISYSVISVYWFAIFIYALIPLVTYRVIFRSLSLLNQWTRLSCTVLIAIKAVCAIMAIFVGFKYDASGAVELSTSAKTWSRCILELPCFFIASCYSLVLYFWFSACTELLPRRYAAFSLKMRFVLIAYNILLYLAFILSAVWIYIPDGWPEIGGYVSIGRDFVLAVIFFIFITILRLSFREESDLGDALDEKRLFGFAIGMSISVLLRGLGTLMQTLYLLDRSDECKGGMLAVYLASEIVLDGLPLFFLILVNNAFLKDQAQLGPLEEPVIGPAGDERKV